MGLCVIAFVAVFLVRRREKSRTNTRNMMATELASSYGHHENNENGEKQEPYHVITPLQLTSKLTPSSSNANMTATQVPRLYVSSVSTVNRKGY